MVLRAKTVELLETKPLTETQKKNSDLNLMELKEAKVELLSYPRRIVLELTNACNLRCIMCGRNSADFAKTFFDPSWLEWLHDSFEQAEEVTMFGWGEPTIHHKFIEILNHVNQFPLRKYFVTNGTRLHQIKDAIFDCAVDIIAISLDGSDAETNDRIRVGSNFEQIITGIASIVKEKRKRRVTLPYMNFVFTAMRSNIHEVPNMIRLAHRLGLEEVKVVYLTVFTEGLLDESLWNYKEEVKAVFDEAIRLAEYLGVKIKLPDLQGEDIAGEKLHKDCYVGWRDFFLGSDGYVRPCQSTAMKLFRYDKYKTFKEAWNSIEMQVFRSRVNNPELMMEECRHCYQSSHANWNKKESFIQISQCFAPVWNKNLIKKS